MPRQMLGDSNGGRFLLPEDQQNRICTIKKHVYACMTVCMSKYLYIINTLDKFRLIF